MNELTHALTLHALLDKARAIAPALLRNNSRVIHVCRVLDTLEDALHGESLVQVYPRVYINGDTLNRAIWSARLDAEANYLASYMLTQAAEHLWPYRILPRRDIACTYEELNQYIPSCMTRNPQPMRTLERIRGVRVYLAELDGYHARALVWRARRERDGAKCIYVDRLYGPKMGARACLVEHVRRTAQAKGLPVYTYRGEELDGECLYIPTRIRIPEGLYLDSWGQGKGRWVLVNT